jgi:hypothetical protein
LSEQTIQSGRHDPSNLRTLLIVYNVLLAFEEYLLGGRKKSAREIVGAFTRQLELIR